MIKKFYFILSVFICIGLIGTFSNAQAKEEKFVFKLAHIVGANSTHGIALEKFAKAVKEETNGNLIINVSHGAALGSGPENIEQVQLGTVEMALLWHNFMASFDKKYAIEDLPFAWSKRWQVYAAYNGEIGEKYRKMVEKLGFKNLAYWELGYRCLTNNKRPIVKPEDLQGIKLRVPEVEIRLKTFRQLGANPIPVAFGELYTALQLGTVDGQENPLPLIQASKFYEIQKYLSLSRHCWTTAFLAINTKKWNSLPTEYQEVLQRNASKFGEYNNYLVRKGEEELVNKLADEGMEVTEIDLPAFKKAVQPIWDEYTKVFGDEIMGLVNKYTSDY